MSSVLLGHCDTAMHAKLRMTEDWDDNKSDLLFVLEAAQAACVGIRDNFSLYILARDALRLFANCF